ncbi:MAG: outer membrane protein [Rhodoblastus sp.]
MFNKLQIIGIALVCLPVSTATNAADLPSVLRPALEPPSATSYDWTGGYIGLHIGAARGWSRATEFNPIGADAYDLTFCNANGNGIYTCNLNGQPHPGPFPISSFNAIGDTWSMKTRGTVAGVTAGYNWQWNRFVYGVEADYGYLSAAGESGPSPASMDDTFLHTSATDYATLRARFGVAFDRLLLFGTAGAASAHFNSYVDDPDIAVGVRTEKTALQWGYAVGAGAEYALTDHITVKFDWLHMEFQKSKSTGYVNITCVPGSCPPQWKLDRAGMAMDGTVGWKISHTLNLFRAGANYKF